MTSTADSRSLAATRMPSVFISHGAPTFALEPGRLGPRLADLGRSLPRPKAVVVVSPHWMTRDPRVTTAAAPATIHDFGGFDPALYDLVYPAPGDPRLAADVIALLRQAGWQASADTDRGLDHGAWVPLRHLYPRADIPVVQVSLPASLDPRSALAFGAVLAPLRDQGVLVVGSGSLTHNLYELSTGGAEAGYAKAFAAWMRDVVTRGDRSALADTLDLAPEARRAHPTTEHLLPLMIAAGAAGANEPVTVLDGGITYGVLAMDSYVFGA